MSATKQTECIDVDGVVETEAPSKYEDRVEYLHKECETVPDKDYPTWEYEAVVQMCARWDINIVTAADFLEQNSVIRET